MPSTLGKNLHVCFAKISCPLSPQSSPAPLNPDEDHDDDQFPPSILFKNFNSLYDYNTFASTSKSLARTHSSSSLSSEPESDSEPDFATVVASQRFFFTSPGRSNSIVESTSSVATPESSHDTPVSISPMDPSIQSSNSSFSQESIPSWNSSSTSCVKDSVAVPTDSPDPYMDFRRSMQEMVEAHDFVDVKANWNYLHELLFCYLALNPKSTHKFIISAFADLLVSLMSTPKTENGGREPQFTANGGCRRSG
ncbi:Transcription repressor like [Melia azedarach]|uniref:Transcription repressor like n=1 Tax=Melia azedarach TaxID=155640 RepID=A0ACC1YVG8_MELAZ|nr:Transcription repressor like [Melia azedarach]